jgi:hypothetical protein
VLSVANEILCFKTFTLLPLFACLLPGRAHHWPLSCAPGSKFTPMYEKGLQQQVNRQLYFTSVFEDFKGLIFHTRTRHVNYENQTGAALQVHTATDLDSPVLWDMTLRKLSYGNRRFVRSCCIVLQTGILNQYIPMFCSNGLLPFSGRSPWLCIQQYP